MFSIKDLIGDALKNYPGGSSEFDEAGAVRPGPRMGMEPDEDDMVPPMDPAQPRTINQSPFGAAMGRERRMR